MDGRTIAGARRKRAKAEEYADLAKLCFEWYQQGISQEDQAERLNAMGKRTSRGGLFTQVAISRILKRAIEHGQIPEPTMPE